VSEWIIELDGLGWTIGGRPILSDLSLRVRGGEYLSVVGPNGAGKSTLLKCLAGVVCDWTGGYRLAGRSFAAWSPRERARRLGYVPQADGRPLPFTAFEFVLQARYPHVRPLGDFSAHDRAQARAALAAADAAELSGRALDTLSGGERQRIFIAAALAQEADILLLDEPATFLDYRHQAETDALLRRLHREQGLTLISVTHDLNRALPASDRVLALRGGRLLFDGPPADFLAGDRLRELYGIAFDRVPAAGRAWPLLIPREEARA